MPRFRTPIDIANRALQHCGKRRIVDFTDQTAGAHETGFLYDKLRCAELRRSLWRFATRRVILRPLDTTTYLLAPSAWSQTTTYGIGSVVSWNGLVYFSLTRANVNIQPDLRPDIWTLYFGPLTVSPWNSEGYSAGELVYNPFSEQYIVYLSLTSNNTDTPGAYPLWDATINYNAGDTVTMGSTVLDFNPGALPVYFGSGFSLPVNTFLGNWTSLTDVNVGNSPATGTHWQLLPTALPNARTGQHWLQLDSTLKAIVIPYPLTAGPVSEAESRNAYYLPNGFIRQAPSDPKGGALSLFGGPTNVRYDDWEFEGNYIVSSLSDPIMLRFVADIADVTLMDDMFCEGLAARIGKEAAPLLVEDKADKVSRIAAANAAYREIMADARAVNAIETGSVEPAEDEWVSCRI